VVGDPKQENCSIWMYLADSQVHRYIVGQSYFKILPISSKQAWCQGKILQVKFGAGAWKVFVATAIMLGCISAMV